MHGRVELLTIRLTDGTLTLTPAWMMRPEAATCAIRPGPRLCVAHLRDLRAHLDALLGSGHGDSSPRGGANAAPEPPPTTGSVRRTAKSTADPNERRRATVEILKALLTEALSSELSTQIRKEAQDEPDRN